MNVIDQLCNEWPDKGNITQPLYVMRYANAGPRNERGDMMTWGGRAVVCNKKQAKWLQGNGNMLFMSLIPEKMNEVIADFSKRYIMFVDWAKSGGVKKTGSKAVQ